MAEVPASHQREPQRSTPVKRPEVVEPYAELHAHSSFSFLDGATGPAELAVEAERLGVHALALTDHDGLYGAVRFAEAAESLALRTIFGAELSVGLDESRTGPADPSGNHLLLLAAGPEGYHRLAKSITTGQLAGGSKGRPSYDLEQLAADGAGHWAVLTGCRKGAVRRALAAEGQVGARRELAILMRLFGADHLFVELIDHGYPTDSSINDALAELAAEQGLPTLATGNVHYATVDQHRLAQTVAAIRARRSLDALDGWLPAAGSAFLHSPAEMHARFARYPGAVARTVPLADALAFSLRRATPALPKQEVPPGHSPASWLRELVWAAVPQKYPQLTAAGRRRIERELEVIESKDFPGYFLIVHDIVAEARRRGILCQGRGSAANSAVCYLLNITAVDSIAYDLPFERFLSALRDEEPDIDVDFDSDRREEIIQWVFDRYGRTRAAQVCNVIQYRPRGAIRDVSRACGYSPGQADAFARQVERWGSAVVVEEGVIPASVVELSSQLLKAPRHLGIHSGGMVLTERPIGEVVPIEHARMDGRTVIQWDKDDAAWMGLVKFDLLGLGILAAVQYSFDLIALACGEKWELSTIPKEEAAVYDMLCRADSIGVFQVESRAQMGLLPRLRPRRFYDLVIQIALIRPGPIQGGAVHPFVRRKMGQEPVSYVHPKLEPVLARTLGIPVFQEQLMQMAMAVGDCSAEDADLLRRAMGSKRGVERIESLKAKLYAGMAGNGIVGETADQLYAQIQAFANFGFAESHSLSFALLVYASSWLKLHYPAAFLAGLLRAQPMGFYSPSTLVSDARRHGVTVLPPNLARSGIEPTMEPSQLPGAVTGLTSCLDFLQPPVGDFDPDAPDPTMTHRRDGDFAVRLGLAGIRGMGKAMAERIVDERDSSGPYTSIEDLVRRTALDANQLEALAHAGAFACFDLSRRAALWRAGSAAWNRPDTLPDLIVPAQEPLFPEPTAVENLADELSSTQVSTGEHPIGQLRASLGERGVLSSAELRTTEPGRRIQIGGLVTHRQRPSTASGITFLSMEDEFGLVNVVCSVGVWQRYRRVARNSAAVVVRGKLERSPEGVVNVLADRIEPLPILVPHRSRDFH